MSRARTSRVAILAAIAALSVLPAASAGAATVVNGDFETGTLSGWQVQRATQAGNWFAYSGTAAPIGSKRPTPAAPVQAPPQGGYAAITDEANPDTLILYQDLSLEPGSDYRLSLLAYYDSYEPIAVPSPDTLSVDEEVLGGQKNQQFRIDVMKPDAPLESLAPGDILTTLLATEPGSPKTMEPTTLSADLGAFAGQTVRLRIANAVHEETFNAGVDDVSLSSATPGRAGQRGGANRGPGGGPGLFHLGRVRPNRRNGTAVVRVHVSEPGLIRASAAGAPAGARARSGGGLGRPIEPVTVPVAAAKTVAIRLRTTRAARSAMRRGRRLRVGVRIAYRPFGGAAESTSVPVTFGLAPRGRHRRSHR